jgi:hypothetical protein
MDRYFRRLYDKYFPDRETRTRLGGTADSFANGHENFLKQAVRELYRAGDMEGAQTLLTELDQLYGSGGIRPHAGYQKPLDLFVQEVTYGEYDMQPEVARSDVYAALLRGYREGLLLGDEKVMKDALKFADDLIVWFKNNKYNDFVNKFGEGRMKDLIGDLEASKTAVLRLVLLDSSQPLLDRLLIYRRAGDKERRGVYDEVLAPITAEFERSPLSKAISLKDALPEPPGMEVFRQEKAAAAAAKAAKKENRSETERK